MTRYAFRLIVLAFLVWMIFGARAVRSDPPPLAGVEASMTTVLPTPFDDAQVRTLRVEVKREHARYLAAHRRVRVLTRVLRYHATTRDAITLACSVYGSCTTLWRRAACETGGTFSPFAHNRSGASGLFQFLPSTWATTPFGGLSIWNPYANALAAGWMQAHGRGGEWVCR
jgi:hypothetical protein